MRNCILTVVVSFFFLSVIGQEKRTVFGKVTDGKTPMENVGVTIINKNMTTATDADGKYKIPVETGDELRFSFVGMKTITIRVEDVTRILNPVMIPEITELGEVTVQNSKRRSQKQIKEEYGIRKNIIRNAYGYIDGDRAPGNIRFVDEKDITAGDLCILDILRGQFAGVSISGNCATGGSVIVRNMGAAIYDIDGQIFTDTPLWLNSGNIKRIAVLVGLGSTALYGQIGSFGVVVINTMTFDPGNQQLVDQALLKNNFVSGKVLTQLDIDKSKPTYLKELEASTSFETAQQIFKKYKNTYVSSPYYYFDNAKYFVNKWGNDNYADDIINTNRSLFENNAVLLKALAYQYEEQGRFEKSHELYKEIFLLRPNYAQSYMDMAKSYRDLKEPKQAASLHARYDYLLEQGFLQPDTLGFEPIMEREFNNLLALNKGNLIKAKKLKELYIAEEDFKGTRLVFEWNDSEAEFDLQFVNPNNQYFIWHHSLADNAETIYREKEYGYNVMEELLDGSLPGTWSVNIKYLGNKSLTPTYLKATIYYNYGLSNQRHETKVFKLSLKNVNQELFKIQSAGKLMTK